MTLPRLRVARWLFTLGLAGLTCPAQVGAAKAQFFDPISFFFSPPPRYVRPVAPRRGPRLASRPRSVLVWIPDRRRVRRPHGPAGVRHARLPRGMSVRAERARVLPAVKEKARDASKTKLVARGPAEDPVAGLMNDPTLRRGDIVVLPGGAKVFKGGANAPHRISDFEDVGRSKLVAERSRRQLAATPVQPIARVQAETGERLPSEDGGVDQQVEVTGSLPRNLGR
jgi:hypothetical protein